jgi:hypothetical protein
MKRLFILSLVAFSLLFVNSAIAENKTEVKKDAKKTETVKKDDKKVDAKKADTKKEVAKAEKCQGTTKAGKACSRNAAKGSKFCFQHEAKKDAPKEKGKDTKAPEKKK